jgi:hypothetical protein
VDGYVPGHAEVEKLHELGWNDATIATVVVGKQRSESRDPTITGSATQLGAVPSNLGVRP